MLRFFLFLLSYANLLSAFHPHPVTPYAVVGYKEIDFFDDSSQQTRKILLWYPIDAQIKGSPSPNLWDVFDVSVDAPISNPDIKKPLIVISHGYRNSTHQLSWLINRLVYDNFVVVGIEHLDEVNGMPQIHIWKRAADIHNLLNNLELQPFANHLDLNKIGFAGFSMGGTTGIWLAGGLSNRIENFVPTPKDVNPKEFDSNAIREALPTLDKNKMMQSWKDIRIKAVFLMAPSWGWIFDENTLQKIAIPTFIIAPMADNVLVTANNAGFFSKHIPKSIYQIILGQANHFVFISLPKEEGKLPSQLDFLIKDAKNVDRQWIQFEIAREASDFFQSVLSLPSQ